MRTASGWILPVVPPDVNHSFADFCVADGKIYFALSAIKGCGGGAADAIVEARRQGGPFTDIFDLCERVEASQSHRATLETLIKAGAMDSFGASRAALTAVMDRAMQAGASAAADRKTGQRSLFDDFEEDVREVVTLPDVPEWARRDKLFYEKDVLGFYLTSHPLEEIADQLLPYCTHATDELPQLADRTSVYVGGMISSIKLSRVRKVRDENAPTKYAMFDLEDLRGNVRCILWPDNFADCGHLVQADAVILAKATVDKRGGGDEVNLIIDELVPLEDLEQRFTRGVMICLDENKHGMHGLKMLHEISRAYPGNGELQLQLSLADGRRVAMTSQKIRVDVVPEYRRRVEELLSPGHFQVLITSPSPGASRPRKRK